MKVMEKFFKSFENATHLKKEWVTGLLLMFLYRLFSQRFFAEEVIQEEKKLKRICQRVEYEEEPGRC